jgi:hypothetical protein
LAARIVRADKRLSRAEANYLVAYAVQYWEHSAGTIGLRLVTREVIDALRVDSPIVLNLIRAHIRRNFPLKGEFKGIEILD